MTSIGSHFYALDSSSQAWRIVEFCEALWKHNTDLSLRQFAQIIRFALRSMSTNNVFPGIVRVRLTHVVIEGPSYMIISSAETTYIEDQPFV